MNKNGILLMLFSVCILWSCSDVEKKGNGNSDSSIIVSHDLSNMRVTAFAEDGLGHIWIGTSHGLNKFDGEEYQHYFASSDSATISDNHISGLFCDSQKRLWVATLDSRVSLYTDLDNFKRIPIATQGLSHPRFIESSDGKILCNVDKDIFVFNEKSEKMDCVISGNRNNLGCFACDSNRIVVVLPNALDLYNTNTFRKEKSIPLPFNVKYAFCIDDSQLWLSSRGQLMIYDMKSSTFYMADRVISDFALDNKVAITTACKQGQSKLYINTSEKGLYIYNKADSTVVPADQASLPFKIGKYEVRTLFSDTNQNLWIGTDGDGAKIISSRKDFFSALPIVTFFRKMSITDLCCYGKEQLWILAFKTDLYHYDVHKGEIRYVKDLKELGAGYGRAISCDHKGNLWITTDISVIQCSYNGTMTTLKRYDLTQPHYVVEDKYHNMWANANFGDTQLAYLTNGDHSFLPLTVFQDSKGFKTCLLPLRNGRTLVTSYNQDLKSVDILQHHTTQLVSLGQILQVLGSSRFVPEVMLEDAKGNIWLGTQSDGVLRYDIHHNTLTKVEGLSSPEVAGMEEDLDGNIWIATLYGLNKCSSEGKVTATYFKEDGLSCNSFSDHVSCKLDDGTLVFGTSQGLCVLNSTHEQHDIQMPIIFESIMINNEFVSPGKGKSIAKILAARPDVHLRYNQNYFTVSFSALNYGAQGNIRYLYKLEGRDKQWIDVGTTGKAYFSNIPAGKYSLRVRAADKNGEKTYSESSLNIFISRSPWNSWWAWFVYIALISLGCYFVLKNRMMALARKREIKRLEEKRQQEQRANEINQRYFANVAHQLRTPLTMISAPVTSLSSSENIKDHDRQLLRIVNHNVGRMLRLINQLMDFNKLETDALNLKVKLTDINMVIRHTLGIYQLNADEKNMTIQTTGVDGNLFMYADADNIENILDNLLSNAIKYTPAGGDIMIEVRQEAGKQAESYFSKVVAGKDNKNFIEIEVANSGPRIPEDQLEKIFIRYYQLDNNKNGYYNWGTGIGLYYAKKLAQLHHGDLVAWNDTERNLTIFSLLLPTEKDAYSAKEMSAIDEEQQKDNATEDHQILRSDDDMTHTPNLAAPLILVVDDDTDITYFIRTLLSPHYRVECFYNVDSAEKSLEDSMPDLILSDIVMGGRNGYEFCKSLKDNILYCHIPVILLTAKDSVQDQIEGLDSGADAYITKPFNSEYLISLVRNMLANRERLRKVLSDSTRAEVVGNKDLSKQDKVFMDELFKLMDAELDNSDFNVSKIVESMHMSHSKFINKVKALTGETPSDLFKNYKLKRAAILLKEGKYNISEVSYMTGFSTLAHFSKVFKKKFGVSPSQYIGMGGGAC